MSCEVCSKVVEDEAFQSPFCQKCGGLLPLPKDLSPFALLGVPESFAVDEAALTARHLSLSQKLHPDRFVCASPSERMRALEWTTALNDAFRLLKSRENRADYLLKARGIDLGAQVHSRMPSAFLEEALEEREALFEAQAEDDHEVAEALAEKIRQRMTRHQTQLEQAFERLEGAEKKGRSDEIAESLEDAALALAFLRYDARFLEEADRFEMEGLD